MVIAPPPTFILYGLSLLASRLNPRTKIDPKPISVNMNGGNDHTAIAIKYSKLTSKMFIGDMGYKKSAVRQLKHNEVEIALVQFLAMHYNNKALSPPLNLNLAAQQKYAEKMFRIALSYDPHNDRVRYNLGNHYFNQRLYVKAEKEYKKAMENNPNHINARYYLNLISRIRGQAL